MNRNFIIGLCGKRRVGKDTFADYIVDNNNFIKYSFAGPLKKACQEMFCFNDNQVEGEEKDQLDDRWGITPRKIYQLMGTEIMREYMPKLLPNSNIKNDFWIRRFKFWYDKVCHKYPNKCIVISDVRFPNEMKIIKKLGGIVIKVNRKFENISNKQADTHASELAVDRIKTDMYINNFGTIEEYYKKIEKNINMILNNKGINFMNLELK